MIKNSLIEWSAANYNDLILDDYLLFGTGSYRNRSDYREATKTDNRIRAVEHYSLELCKRFKVSRKKLCMAYNDEIGCSKVRELAAGHSHIAVSNYLPKSIDPKEAAHWSNEFWRENYGISRFEPFDPKKKLRAISYLTKVYQGNELVLNDFRTTKAMKKHLEYLKNN